MLASPPARASETSISSCVRFFDCRNATLLSTGDDATLGSCKTEVMSVLHMLGFGLRKLTCHLLTLSVQRSENSFSGATYSRCY